ncbi:MAG: SGNH/GDSL hydrolase family protein [Rhodoferax sp.]|nr:SGNH/GDSL hydrolase family protein [Rhodoferax sp.]
MLFKRLRSLLLPLLVSVPLGALAGPFTSLFVFGDSLSDTGNLATAFASATGQALPTLPPQPVGSGFNGPYYQNSQLSNGPVWIEHLGAGLGLASNAAAPALLGGNNFAFAGARTGTSSIPPGVLAQAFGLWGGNDPSVNPSFADPSALYVVVGGGDDMRDARDANPGITAADRSAHGIAAAAAVTNLANTLAFLASKGVKNVLVSTLPDLGFTPEAALRSLLLGLPDLQAASSDASDQFNALIQTSLMGFGASLGLHMNLLDIDGLFNDVLTHPGSFGITNTDLPCAGFEFSAGASCNTSLFADVLHPSAFAHSLIARAALEVLGVPEPETLALFGLALLALALARRRAA